MRRDLTEGNVTSSMLLFAVPMILGNMLQQCYNLADTWIVGRFIGPQALAAVGSAYTLMTFLNSLIIGMCMGSGALFSVCFGGKNLRRLKEYVLTAGVLIFAATAVITAASVLLLDPILSAMRVPEDVFGMMSSYMKMILIGLAAVSLYNYFAFLLRSLGNSAAPLAALGVSTVVNIALDYLFVAVLGRGTAGAAEATVIAQVISGVGLAVYALLREPLLSVKGMREDGVRLRRKLFPEIISCAAATGAQQSVMNFGILMVQGLVNSFGSTVMAAFAAGVKIDTLAYMPAQEFGNAYSIFVSQNHGAGRQDRVRAGTKSAAAIVLVFCLIVSAAVFAGSEHLMSWFVDAGETGVIRTGAVYLKTEGACYCGIGILFLLYGYFRGVERPYISLLLTVISLGTRVALAYLLAPGYGVLFIWLAIPTGWILADVTGLILMRRRAKEHR